MGNIGRAVRGSGRIIFSSIGLLIVAVYVLLPAKAVSPRDLEDPPIDRFVEVTFDRIQPLPWTLIDERYHTIQARFALGWLGKRALLIQTDGEIPADRTFFGALSKLDGTPKKWVDKAHLAAVIYGALLTVTNPYDRIGGGLVCLSLGLLMLVVGVRRYRQRNDPMAAWRAENPLTPLLEAARPRSDKVVAAVVRKHGAFLGIPFSALLYALLVMTLFGSIVGTYLDGHMWDKLERIIIMFPIGFVLASPMSILPFLWWMRRYRREFARVARDGELCDGIVVWAVARGMQINRGSSSRITMVRIEVPAGLVTRRYSARIHGPGWMSRGTAVRLLMTPDDQLAIVITQDGGDFVAKRIDIPKQVWLPLMWLRPSSKRKQL